MRHSTPLDLEFFVGQYLIELPDGRLAFLASETATNRVWFGDRTGLYSIPRE